MPMKPIVALLTGGFTKEAEVSVKSAAFVEQNIPLDHFDVYLITITQDSWYYVDRSGHSHEIDRADFSLHIDGNHIRFDLAFIMIHGSPGEDGLLQGYFDLIGLRYTSCDTLTSAITMNKAYTKNVLRGIPELHLAASVVLLEAQQANVAASIANELTLPYFVKPNAGGSSIGMSKVRQVEELQAAIDLAFQTKNTGKQVIVEEFIEGREFTVGAYRLNGEIIVLPATEVITQNDFFDFEAKYQPGLTEEITPADLNEEQFARVERIVQAIYTKLNCKGMIRTDFFLEKGTDKFFFVEINTIPGQTGTSFIPQQVRAYGKTETDFYTEIILEALRA